MKCHICKAPGKQKGLFYFCPAHWHTGEELVWEAVKNKQFLGKIRIGRRKHFEDQSTQEQL